jgi:hypothetical protein
MADLLIFDEGAIELVEKLGLRQVSLGYDADYIQTAPGKGRQTNIVGNHIALVRKGRNGAGIAVRDSAPDNLPRSKTMKGKLGVRMLMTLLGRAVDEAMPGTAEVDAGAGDMEARVARIEEMLATLLGMADEVEAGDKGANPGTTTAVVATTPKAADAADPLQGRLDIIEASLAKLLEQKSTAAADAAAVTAAAADAASKVIISSKNADADVLSRAEILAPGLTTDGDLIKESVAVFTKTKDGADLVKTFDGITDDAVLFKALSETMKARRASQLVHTIDTMSIGAKGVMTAEQMNKANEARYATK